MSDTLNEILDVQRELDEALASAEDEKTNKGSKGVLTANKSLAKTAVYLHQRLQVIKNQTLTDEEAAQFKTTAADLMEKCFGFPAKVDGEYRVELTINSILNYGKDYEDFSDLLKETALDEMADQAERGDDDGAWTVLEWNATYLPHENVVGFTIKMKKDDA